MPNKGRSLAELATRYNQNLPNRIRQYLNGRGIPDVVIEFHLLGWNGQRITIPIFNRDGELTFFKLAKDPQDKLGPKMLATPGSCAELYGWEHVKAKPKEIIICEGEFDRLVLEANRFRAVTSTGGAGVFRFEWAKELQAIPEIYICYDRDDAGRAGGLRVARMIPHAKIIELPEEVGESGDVTDFFVRLKKTREDFLRLMGEAKPAPPTSEAEVSWWPPPAGTRDSTSGSRAERLKREVPILQVVERYIKLRRSGHTMIGLCPFHSDHIPSLVVYPDTDTFHCYGCRKHGDVITFIMEIDHLTFKEALDALEQLTPQK